MRASIRFFAPLLLACGLTDCSCDDQILIPSTPGSCEPDFACPAGYEYRRGECKPSRCMIDSDCCPGQKCNAAAGFCADQYVACTDDDDCTEVPGQSCIDFRGGRYCGYPNGGNALSGFGTQTCASDAECAGDRSCFGGRCVLYAPCQGGCPAGQICDVDSNTCFTEPSCTETCQPGQMLVVADPDQMSGPMCCLVECKCETLPPVLAGQPGFHAAIAASQTLIFVSNYDPIYGDLAVAIFDHQGARVDLHYVDGFPSDGPIVANPAGPRGGRIEPGPNVGEHTSIASDGNSDVFHVAYYDRDEGRLKYALFDGGAWTSMVVDESAHVGMYTSIAIGPDGNPWIAYMMVEGTVDMDPTPRTGLKLARATSSRPESASDWQTFLVDSAPIPPPICMGGCGSGQECVDLGGAAPECRPASTACADTCADDELCVDVNGTPSCELEYNLAPLTDLIEGTGLFADLAFDSAGRPLIAYYDRLQGDLRLATGNGDGTFALATVDGNDMMNPTDVGQHASIAVGPTGNAAIAYFDATNADLVYFDLAGGTREIVDDGITPPDLRLVGADASLLFDQNGDPAIAYQDPTLIDLLYARRTGAPPAWWSEVLKGDPPSGGEDGTASGFYAAQIRIDDNAVITNTDVSFDAESNLILDLSVLVHELR
jgi:hypothetical protein